MKLVTAAQMRELDRQAIHDLGIPSLVLMENAGRTTYQVLRREFPDLSKGVAVLAGKGNNGGDGLVVARYLANDRLPVTVFLFGDKNSLSGDARVNLDILAHLPVNVVEVTQEAALPSLLQRLSGAALIVDALLGTGLKNEVHGLLRLVIHQLNQLHRPVLAVDIPSGLCADTGRPLGVAVQAHVTVTFGWPKIGQILSPGRDYVGRLWLVDISIPPALAAHLPLELADAAELQALWPARPFAAHKGTFGHLVVLAGSEGKTGAAALAAEGALRLGTGLVTAAVPASLNDILEVKLTEAMTLPLPEAQGARAFGRSALPPLLAFMADKSALAVGPGLGTHPETQELVRHLVRQLPQPMVIDADGLNALAGDLTCLHHVPGPRILTPHPGEMARLLAATTTAVQARRLQVAQETAARFGVIVVLKGAHTVVAHPDGRLSLNPTGNPALASGGTGDVLTGLIGGLLAQKLDPWDAARLGVFLHGLAADFLTAQRGPTTLVAGDLVTVLPTLLPQFLQGRFPPQEIDICLRRVIS